MMKRVVVGLSGGVDSSVAALLLKQQGYDVVGLFMINWHDTTGVIQGDCPWKDDVIFAELVARKLEIPFHTIDFSEQYSKRVVDYMFNEYQRGRTPNPDVLCNREVKFDLFLNAAIELDADYIATGHYCRKEEIIVDGKTIYRLLAGVDKNKDQSYFLCQLSQSQISKALFPIGHLNKPEVRKIADEYGLATATRKDSQGICFVGKVDLPDFLQQKLAAKKGKIVEIPKGFYQYKQAQELISSHKLEDYLKEFSTGYTYQQDDGIIIGEHNGAHYYTVGQRKGLNIGGKEFPLFVIATDCNENIIYVGMGEEHPGLYRKTLFIPANEIHWIRDDQQLSDGQSVEMLVRIRYRQPLQKATLLMRAVGLTIVFEKEQRSITSGQFAAWYSGEEMMGSGVIS
jgi:tRNA-uridine 2-sulfurtransferase